MIVVFGLFWCLVSQSDGTRRVAADYCGPAVCDLSDEREGRAGQRAGSSGFESCVAFRRRELERQRDLLRSIGLWYLGPLVPGVVLFNLGVIAPKVRVDHPADWWRGLPALAIMVVWFWVVIRVNRRAADHLQRSIDELTRVAGQ